MKAVPINYFEDNLEDASTLILPDEGEKLELNNISFTFKVTSEMTNGQTGVYEILLPPGAIGAQLHYHRFMDETFVVIDGSLTLQIAGKTTVATAGTIAHVPKFTPHGFRNNSDQNVKLLLIFNPSQGREGFFKGLHKTLSEVPIDPEKFLKLYNKYDSYPVDTNNMLPVKE